MGESVVTIPDMEQTAPIIACVQSRLHHEPPEITILEGNQ